MDNNQNQPCSKRCSDGEKSWILKFTFPGFNYLGPGSKIDNGPPTNEVDVIAKKHDEAYSYIIDRFKESKDIVVSTEEIRKADIQFLEDLTNTKTTTVEETIGKFVGLLGIGIKVNIENFLGHIFYPDFNKIKHKYDAECSRKINTEEAFNEQ